MGNSATVGQRRNKQQRYKRHPELFYSNNDALQLSPLDTLFSVLPTRYSKYKKNFQEYGVNNYDSLRLLNDEHLLNELGVQSSLERKIILERILKLTTTGTQPNAKLDTLYENEEPFTE